MNWVRVVGVGVPLLVMAAGCGGQQGAAGSPALYVTNWNSNNISRLAVGPDGALRAPAVTTPIAAGTENPQGSVRSADGRWLYVGNWGSGDVTAYEIRPDGSLKAGTSAKVENPPPLTPSAIVLGPTGRDLYTANNSDGGAGTVSHYRLAEPGHPAPVSTIPAHGGGTTGLCLSPDGRALLTANSGTGDVSLFSVAADGELAWRSTTKTGAGAFVTAMTPDGRHALVTNSLADTISLLSISVDGAVAVTQTVPSRAHEPRGVVLNRAGTLAYVSNFAGGTGPGAATVFRVEGGGLRFAGSVPTGSNGSEGLALAPDEQTLYVANFNRDGQGSVTAVHLAGGLLGTVETPVLTGGQQPDLGSITVPRG
jgi:6-phosphogluconolactonase (cycloisomerase 2 family)